MRSNHAEMNPDGDWNRVSGATPCTICGGRGDCRTHVDEAFAWCVEQPSDWCLTDGGWLHRIEQEALTISAGHARKAPELRVLAAASGGVTS